MATLTEIVRQEVRKYAAGGEGANLRLFPLLDEEYHNYAVIDVEYPVKQYGPAGVVVMARVVGDTVIIEEDTTDKRLVDALLQRGIPREKIILAYEGESTEAYPSRIPLPSYD